MARQVNVAILIVGERARVDDNEERGICADEWAGVLRKEDIRGMERDKVKVQEAFRIGDLVRGEVVSLRFSSSSMALQKGRERFSWLVIDHDLTSTS